MTISMTPSALTHLPVSGTMRSPTIDYSSLSTLSSCQMKWWLKHVVGIPDPPGPALQLGTLLHELCEVWWAGGDWERRFLECGHQWMEEHPEAEFVPEFFSTAEWLMRRYDAHYGPTRHEVEVLAQEEQFKVRLPGRYGWLVGRIDGRWRLLSDTDGGQWLVERKSMRDWNKLDTYTWDPQVTLYWWAAREMGHPVKGVVVDAIRTYRWKRDPHPPEDSFKRMWVDRNDTHLESAVAEAAKGLSLAKALINRKLEPLRNPDQHCSWCGMHNECVSRLCFGADPFPSLAFEGDE